LETDNVDLHLIKDGSFLSSSGEEHCYIKRYYPKGKLSKKVIHIIFQHGAIEYHKRHEELFDSLRSKFGNKLVISCLDLVGHGYSGGTRAYVNNFRTYIDDFLKFIRTDQDLYREHDVETHIIAHSLGGMIAIKTLVDSFDQIPFKISSMILTNPCIKPKFSIPKFANKLTLSLSKNLGKMRLPSLYDGFDLTRDRDRAIAFNHDYLNSHFMTIRMGTEIIKASKEIRPYSYYIKTPMYFILSGEDLIVDNETTKLFISGLNESITKTSYYPGARHDILNETCRKQVFEEIIEYIDNRDWERECVD
jgi:lysophospholipase